MDRFVISVLFLALCGTPAHGDMSCNLKEHFKCSNVASQIKLDGMCEQIEASSDCMEELMVACGNKTRPSDGLFCQDEEESMYCSILDGSSHAPMSSARHHHKACSIYNQLKGCHQKKCGPGAKDATTDRIPYRGAPDSCSVDATKKCVSSLSQVTEVTKDNCIEVGAAKTCFIDELDRCSGNDVQQHTVDIILVGLVHHVKQCKEKGYGFSKGGDVCVPNPLDAFIPTEVEQMMKSPLLKPTKELCQKINKMDAAFTLYLEKCNVTDYNKYTVNDALGEMTKVTRSCYNAGFKPVKKDSSGDECDCGSGSHSVFTSNPLRCIGLAMVAVAVRLFTRMSS